MSWFNFLKVFYGCWVENRLKKVEGGGWEVGWEINCRGLGEGGR